MLLYCSIKIFPSQRLTSICLTKDQTENETKEEDYIQDLTESEQKEKESLLQKGFGNWNKREFHAFLRGLSL